MRISKDHYFMAIAKLVSTRATCPRRWVGCVLINKRGHILATGYNGVPAGVPHCTGTPCPGVADHTSLDACEAVHAEQNALLQCRDVHEIEVAYITIPPCVPCMKLLMNTSCQRIVHLEDYSKAEPERWRALGRQWEKLE